MFFCSSTTIMCELAMCEHDCKTLAIMCEHDGKTLAIMCEHDGKWTSWQDTCEHDGIVNMMARHSDLRTMTSNVCICYYDSDQ